ncbi:MAG: hypothetical protein INR73_10575 [Williamsia sp.]|nr:hypothetical protein [Williamsia sp.]
MQKLAISLAVLLVFSISATSCSKDSTATSTDPVQGVHKVDPRIVGKWMWTKGSDGAYYDNNGVYKGSAYGFAWLYTINADGSGTAYSHVYSTIGIGTGLEVNISYKGFYETDDQGHLGFFPTSGTYQSTSGENRALRADELWNTKTNTGRSFVNQQLVFTTQGNRTCFQVTSSNGVTDTFFKQ